MIIVLIGCMLKLVFFIPFIHLVEGRFIYGQLVGVWLKVEVVVDWFVGFVDLRRKILEVDCLKKLVN